MLAMGRSEEKGCSPLLGRKEVGCPTNSPHPASKGPIWSMEQTDRKWYFLSTTGAVGLGFLRVTAKPPSTLSAAEVPGAPAAFHGKHSSWAGGDLGHIYPF